MTTLALDTCFGACSVAICAADHGPLLAERFQLMEKGHSECIVPMIGAALGAAGLPLAQIRTVAVTIGPGSFTGVRTGLAVARAFALAHRIELRCTTSLHVMAESLRQPDHNQPVAIAVETRDGLVYFQVFNGATGEVVAPAWLAAPAQAAASLGDRRYTLAGSGAGAVVAAAAALGYAHDHYSGQVYVRAGVLARMSGYLAQSTPAKPLYLREPDAKPQAALLVGNDRQQFQTRT